MSINKEDNTTVKIVINKVNQENQTITIPIKEYSNLLDDSLLLNALQRTGVDNWEWYGEALKIYEEEKE